MDRKQERTIAASPKPNTAARPTPPVVATTLSTVSVDDAMLGSWVLDISSVLVGP